MPDFDTKALDEDAVLKEVWNIKDVKAKTELSDTQIEAVNKLSTLAFVFNSKLLRTHLNDFMVLQKSRNRKSMEEFVNVVKARREDFVNKGKNFFNSMMG